MGLIEDFLNNNVPQAPPPPEPQPKQDKRLGNWSLSRGAETEEVETEPQAEVPPTTVDLSNMPQQQPNPNLKELNKDRNTTQQEKVAKAVKGMKPNYYETQTTTKTKAPSERVEVTERIGTKQAYKDWEKESSPYNKVLEQLRLNPPKKPLDSERMRKMAGVQAISEALRNVVDAVQGQRKAVIVPHKTYTNEFLKEAQKADADYASQLAKWQKTLSETQKSAFEMYLKEVAQNDKTNIRKVITNTGESTTTTRDTEGRRTYAPRSNFGRSGSGKQILEIKSANTGTSWELNDANANTAFSYITNQTKSGIDPKRLPAEYQSLIKNVQSSVVQPSAKNLHAFIQYVYDLYPEAGDRFAQEIKAQQTQGKTSVNAMGKATKTSLDVKKKTNQSTKTGISGKQTNTSPVAKTSTNTSSKPSQPAKNQANTNPYAKYKE
jgi:hypothetical protein